MERTKYFFLRMQEQEYMAIPAHIRETINQLNYK